MMGAMKKTNSLSPILWTVVVLIGRSGASCAEESVLPHGAAPAAIRSLYFPDRVHEFVWRNWEAVEPTKLAGILGTSVDEVTALAERMGLSPTPVVLPEMRTRGYLTLIRRNWHLLPYEQLLELLDLTPERLSVMLREEDFLWYKLGLLKPACDPLRYQPPDESAKKRAEEIRRVVEEEFGERLRSAGEPRFDFVRRLSAPLPNYTPPQPGAEQERVQRIVYSYVAVYGDPLLHPELNPYPDGLLQRLSEVGINGVWLQAVLRDFAPGGPAFPEFGADHERRLESLRALVERAATFGVRVYLYINEPWAMPPSFFKDRPELAGVEGAELTALCTSQPPRPAVDGRCSRSRFSRGSGPWRRLCDHRLGESHQLRLARRLAILSSLQRAH